MPKKSRSSENQTYYEILGVGVNATHDEIEDAYHSLARQYHPDVTKDDIELTQQYMLINEAYLVLSNRVDREKYNLMMRIDVAIPDVKKDRADVDDVETVVPKKKVVLSDIRLLDAKLKRAVKRAYMLCKQADFWQAHRVLEKFLNTHPEDVDLRKMLARAALGMNRYREAVTHQKVVCRNEYFNADSYAMLGKIYLKAGQLGLAERALSDALSWNSDHAGAVADLTEVHRKQEEQLPLAQRMARKLGKLLEKGKKDE